MAIAYDANSQGEASSTTTLTVSHTCTGTDRLLLAAVSVYDGTPDIGTCTYNGVSMTNVGSVVFGSSSGERITLFGLKAPATGANNIVVTVTGTHWLALGAISLTGVDQTTPWGTAGTDTVSNSKNLSIDVSSETDDLVVDAVAWWNQDGGLNVGAGQTQRVINENAAAEHSVAMSTEAGATTVTMSESFDANEYGGQVAVNINASSGSADITPSAVTVTATPGSMVTTVGSVAITPAVVTVTATPGTVVATYNNAVALTGATITASPGTATITTGSLGITPSATTVTATPGTMVLTDVQSVTPDPVTVSVTPGSLSVAAGAVAIVPDPVTVTVTPGSLSLAAGQVNIVPDPATVTVTPGSVALTAGSVAIVPDPVTVSVTPGTVSVAIVVPQELTLTGPTVTVTAGTLVVTQTYLFTPGTTGQAVSGQEEHHSWVPGHQSMWRLYGTPVGVGYTVIIASGVATASPGRLGASVDDLAAADAGSGDNDLGVFTRGATYNVTEAEKDILVAAGYTMN